MVNIASRGWRQMGAREFQQDGQIESLQGGRLRIPQPNLCGLELPTYGLILQKAWGTTRAPDPMPRRIAGQGGNGRGHLQV